MTYVAVVRAGDGVARARPTGADADDGDGRTSEANKHIDVLDSDVDALESADDSIGARLQGVRIRICVCSD